LIGLSDAKSVAARTAAGQCRFGWATAVRTAVGQCFDDRLFDGIFSRADDFGVFGFMYSPFSPF
jgi:hypothetical protein